MLFAFILLLAFAIGVVYAVVCHDGVFAFFGFMVGAVIFLFGNLLGSALNDNTNVVETQKNVSVSLKVVNDQTVYSWVYAGRQFAVPMENDTTSPYAVFTKASTDKNITVEKYEDNKFWTLFGPKSDDTIYRISTGALAK